MRQTFLLLSLSIAIFYRVNAQAIFIPMKEAVKSANAGELAKHFNKSVDLNLGGEMSTYSKEKAEIVLRDFFKKHLPTDFTIIHTGSSKGGLQFAIGKYQSDTTSYNVLLRVREVGKTYLIHEISFTKE